MAVIIKCVESATMNEKKQSIEKKLWQLTSLRIELKTIEFVLNDKFDGEFCIKYRKTILILLLNYQLETFNKEN